MRDRREKKPTCTFGQQNNTCCRCRCAMLDGISMKPVSLCGACACGNFAVISTFFLLFHSSLTKTKNTKCKQFRERVFLVLRRACVQCTVHVNVYKNNVTCENDSVFWMKFCSCCFFFFILQKLVLTVNIFDISIFFFSFDVRATYCIRLLR